MGQERGKEEYIICDISITDCCWSEYFEIWQTSEGSVLDLCGNVVDLESCWVVTAIDWIGTLNTFTYSEESSIFWMSLRFSLGKNFALLDTREITHRVIQAQTGSSLCCQYDEIVLMNRDILYSIISEFFLLHVCKKKTFNLYKIFGFAMAFWACFCQGYFTQTSRFFLTNSLQKSNFLFVLHFFAFQRPLVMVFVREVVHRLLEVFLINAFQNS